MEKECRNYKFHNLEMKTDKRYYEQKNDEFFAYEKFSFGEKYDEETNSLFGNRGRRVADFFVRQKI